MTRVSWHLSPHLSGLTFEYNTYGKSREYLLVKASFFFTLVGKNQETAGQKCSAPAFDGCVSFVGRVYE